MKRDQLHKKIISGVLWQGFERIGSSGISFVVSIILARLLSPKEFGTIAIMLVFITLCQVFVDSGFSTALIQKKNITEADCCSVFYINIIMAALLYCIVFAAAPFIASFYKTPSITFYLRILSITMVIRSFSIIQNALLRKRMLFRLSFRISWVALIVSGAIGITMAYSGCGVWALIAQQLANAAVTAAMEWLLVRWRPQCIFNWESIRTLYRFGWKIFCSGFLDTLYKDIYSLVIGKISNLTMLSYYDRGKTLPASGMMVINSTLRHVLLPAFSEIQDDKGRMKQLAQKGLKSIMFLVIPLLGALFVFADPIVRIVLTEKWIACVIFVRLGCLTFMFWPLHTMNLQILTASGRSDVYLILEIIKKIQVAIIILATYRIGVVAMVVASTAFGLVSFFENAWMTGRLIDYPHWRQLLDILPLFAAVALSGVIAYFLSEALANVWLKILVGMIMFSIIYLLVCICTRNIPDEFRVLFSRWQKRES